MKKLAYATAALFVVLIGAVLVVPSFIDWNQYKTEITSQAFEATGRELIVDGDIHLSLLPSPSLEVNKVRLANLTGGDAPEMVTLRSAVVNVAMGPLIGGRIQVESVRLNDPVIHLEVLPDGRKNWEFNAPEENGSGSKQTAQEPEKQTGSDSATDLPVQVDSFKVVNGTVVYRDHKGGTLERVDGLDATVVAGSLIGPFDANGSFVTKGLPLSFEVSIGKIIHGRTVGFATSLKLGEKGKTHFSGTLVDEQNTLRVKGDIKAESANLADLIGALTGGGTYPGLTAQSFAASGPFTATAAGVELPDLTMELGDAKARIAANATFGDVTGIGVAVAAKRIDLDDWLARPPFEAKGLEQGEKVAVIDKTDGGPRASVSLTPQTGTEKKSAANQEGKQDGFALPKNVSAAVNVDVEALAYKGGAVRNAKVSVELVGGEITVNQASAQLPGGSDVALFGFVGVDKGAPKFDGTVEASVNDLRGVLRWLQIPQPELSQDRLRKLTVKSAVKATPSQIDLSETKVVLDSSTISGGAAIALRKRPSFGATLTVDRLNLDSYLNGQTSTPADTKKPAPTGKTDGETEKKAEKTGAETLPSALQGLKALAEFDANVNLLISSLTAQGATAKNTRLEASLYRGDLNIKALGADNIAGASFNLSGQLNKLGGVPEAKGLKVSLSAQNTARLFELLQVAPPISPKQLGAVKLKAVADGSLLSPKVDIDLAALGGTFGVSGQITPFDLLSGLKAQFSVNHGDLAGLTQALDLGYRPAGKNIKIVLSGTALSTGDALSISNLTGNIAGATVKGEVASAKKEGRQALVADLEFGDLVVDPLLPGNPSGGGKAASKGASGSGASSSSGNSTPEGERWSREPLDLSGLKGVDADIKVKGNSITYGNYRVDKASASVGLYKGVLTVAPLKGQVFGGQFDSTARLDAAATPKFEGVITLRGSDVGQGTRAVTGKSMASGTLSVSSKMAATGNSVYELVSNMNGEGDFALNKLDVNAQQASGTAIAGVLNLVKALNGLGGGKSSGLADVTGSYVMTNGVARSDNLRLASGVASGGAKGTVDLPAWLTDVSGEVNMSQSALGIVLKLAKVKVPDRVPFSVKGPLDNPKVVLLTNQSGSGASGSGSDAPPDPRAPVQQQPKKEKLKPEDIFKQLLKGGLR